MKQLTIFVTGTDTGVGKTQVACALLAFFNHLGFKTLGVKPIACGGIESETGFVNPDALALLAQSTVAATVHDVNPFVFRAPIAPQLAASAEGALLTVAALKTHLEKCFANHIQPADVVIIEGVGGWWVPLNDHETMVDFAVALRVPVLLVVGLKVGCLNHALLTADAIRRAGLSLMGWVGNAIEANLLMINELIQNLEQRLACPKLAHIPYTPYVQAVDKIKYFALLKEMKLF